MYDSPTNINVSSGLSATLNYLNNVTFTLFPNMFLLAVYCISMFAYYKAQDDFPGALAVSGFGTFIIALLFWMGDFVNGWTLSASIGLMIIGATVLYIATEQ